LYVSWQLGSEPTSLVRLFHVNNNSITAAVPGPARAGAGAPLARPQGLFPARARGECIGKGKAHRPYEFGVKVSVATTVKNSADGQFVTHAAARRAGCGGVI